MDGIGSPPWNAKSAAAFSQWVGEAGLPDTDAFGIGSSGGQKESRSIGCLCADSVPLGEQHHVARDGLGGRDPLLASIAHDRCRHRRNALERLDCPLLAPLLHVAEQSVQDDDRGDDDRLGRTPSHGLTTVGLQNSDTSHAALRSYS